MIEKNNITNEPFVRVQFVDNTEKTLSLRDTILESHRISEIVSDSVTEAAAIRRFLLALFIRVYADYLKHEDWWLDVYQTCVLPTEPLEKYLQQWEDRFDLFHPTHPFFQHPSPESDKPQSLNVLRLENASGNNAVLFSHSNEEDSFMMTNAEAARALITAQAYAVGGGVSKPFNFSHGVLVSGGLVFWVGGNTLLQSLLLNSRPKLLRRLDRDSFIGTPSWEHEPVRALQYPANGILHLFTFLSRRFRLVRHDENTVKAVILSQGDKNISPLNDPMMAYITNNKGETTVLNLNRERALWRSYYALYAEQTTSSQKPATLQYAIRAVPEGQRIELEVFGLQTDKGKIEHSRMEKLVYYPSIAGDNNKVSALQKMILDSDTVSSALSKALWLFAQIFLYPETKNLSDTQRAEITAFKQSIDCSAQYWANAGTRINSLIARLSRLDDADERGDLIAEWRIFLKSTAIELLERQLESISGNASVVYRAFAAAQRFFQIESSKF